MAVSLARSVERSRLAWLSNRLPPLLRGLAFERRASWPGPRRGVAQKRRERHGGFWNQACPPRSLPASMEEGYSDGGCGDRGRSAQDLAYGGDDQRGGGAAG